MSAIRPFQHTPSSPVLFGVGSSSTIADKTLLKRCTKIQVVTDRGVVAAGLLDPILKALGARVFEIIDDLVVPDADCAHVDVVAARAKAAGVDAVLAVGGGSVIDSAKGVCMGIAKGVPVASLEGIATVRMKTLPLVCVPTTAGTGSEATQFAVLMDRQAHKKRIYVDANLIPALAVLDPALVVGLPPAVTCATAVDALTHALEAVASKMRNPLATSQALEAVRLLIEEKGLARSLKDPGDVDARGDCMMAAHLAGRAVSSAMLGACHALAHVLGARSGVPHGVANGLFLVPVLKANAPKSQEAYQRLARTLGVVDVDAAIAVVEEFVHGTAGIPRRLRDVASSLTLEDLPLLAKEALADPDLPTNPVAVDEAGLLTILRERW
ncbi:MAG: iron-containing alcohol dehydrogenase [Deltaproteobacteria bacterium]|nr:iron-containing alcohol dehydrogenase [Deltaproteobacteria bacterium]